MRPRRWMHGPWLALALSCLSVSLAASVWAGGAINAVLDKQQVTVGEPFAYTVTLTLPAGAQYTLPGEKAKFGKLEVRDYQPTDTPQADGSRVLTLVYTLVAFDTGAQTVGDFKVPVRPAKGLPETYLAPPVQINVESVLPGKGQQVEPKGFYGPITLKAGWAEWLRAALIALAVLAVIALIIWLIRRRRRVAGTVAVPEIILPPDEAALQALERLETGDLVARGDLLGFYLRLDEVLRAWLEARFEIPALHRTTLGITYFLRARRTADPWRQEFMDLLKTAAAVKFAKLQPADEQALGDVHRAREVIRRAAPPPEVPPPPGGTTP